MKNIFSFALALLSLLSLTYEAEAQGRYEVRLTHNKFNCATDSVEVCVEIRATSADSVFTMGSGNIFLIFANDQLANPVFRKRGIYSQGGDYNLMTMTVTTGATSTAVSLNIENIGFSGAGKLVTTDWTTVACLAFNTVNPNNSCYSLTVSPTNPSTVITMAYKDPTDTDPNNPKQSLTKTVTQGALTPITNQCPPTPVVSVTGTTTINQGQNANLTIGTTNGQLPATVTLTGGINVQLDAQNPTKTIQVSPNLTTTYEVLTATGTCGAGAAAQGQSSAIVTVLNSSGCIEQKCIPATIVIIK